MTFTGSLLAEDEVPSDVWPGLGLTGGLVLGALIVVSLLLWLNMRRQLRRINVPTAAELRERDAAASGTQRASGPDRSEGDARGDSTGDAEKRPDG